MSPASWLLFGFSLGAATALLFASFVVVRNLAHARRVQEYADATAARFDLASRHSALCAFALHVPREHWPSGLAEAIGPASGADLEKLLDLARPLIHEARARNFKVKP